MDFISTVLLALFGIYLIIGIVFYFLFLGKLAGQLDENTNGASFGFKVLILPGIISLWPVVLMRWKKAKDSSVKKENND